MEIFIGCMFGAYLLMKIRDYTKTAELIKKTIATPQKVEKQYQTKINGISGQIRKVQNQQEKLEIQPTTHRNRRKLKQVQRQLARLRTEQKEVEAALGDYQIIVEKMTDEDTPNIKQELRSYLRNKNRL